MRDCKKFCYKKPENIYISKNKAQVGNIVLTNNKIVSAETFLKKKMKLEDIAGVVAVPVIDAIDNKIRVMALEFMGASIPGGGSQIMYSYGWGIQWDTSTDQELLDMIRNDFPNTNVNNAPSSQITGINQNYGWISTQEISEIANRIADVVEGFYFINRKDPTKWGPSVLLEDGTLNHNFIKDGTFIIEGTSTEVSIKSAFADFNGENNTKLLLSYDTETQYVYNGGKTDYLPAKLCSLYNKGNMNWYLPAAGELTYWYANLKTINDELEKIGIYFITTDYSDRTGTYVKSPNIWSSTPSSLSEAQYLNVDYGGVFGFGNRSGSFAVVPFAAF